MEFVITVMEEWTVKVLQQQDPVIIIIIIIIELRDGGGAADVDDEKDFLFVVFFHFVQLYSGLLWWIHIYFSWDKHTCTSVDLDHGEIAKPPVSLWRWSVFIQKHKEKKTYQKHTQK